jgi:hypothetical protein
MKDWAQFQPKLSKPRQDPGCLFFPAEYTHVFQKYWDGVQLSHSFSSMKEMEDALAPMSLDSWEPQPDSIAPEKSQRIARTAALSRKCPIQDAVDYWSTPEEQTREESVTGTSGFAPAQDVHNVDI